MIRRAVHCFFENSAPIVARANGWCESLWNTAVFLTKRCCIDSESKISSRNAIKFTWVINWMLEKCTTMTHRSDLIAIVAILARFWWDLYSLWIWRWAFRRSVADLATSPDALGHNGARVSFVSSLLPCYPIMNLRQRIQILILLTLVMFTFASYHEGTGSTTWLQWLTAAVFVTFMLVFDMAFTSESGFIFDPDADNWRRKTVREIPAFSNPLNLMTFLCSGSSLAVNTTDTTAATQWMEYWCWNIDQRVLHRI